MSDDSRPPATFMAIDPDTTGMVDGYGVDAALVERAIGGAPVGVTLTDPDRPDNPLVYVNDAFTRITGYEREDILGQNCRFLQGPDTDPEPVAELREAIDAREPVTVELLNYRADGEQFWNEVTVAPLTDDTGEVTHFVGFQSDVTARKEAELALEERTEHLEHLVGRIDGLLQDVTEGLMQATSRSEGEQAVVERIASVEPYVFAWFGEPDRSAGTIVPSTWAGDGASLADLSIDLDADDPTVEAYRTASVTSGPVTGSACADRVPSAAAVAATPIAYGDTVYGVLTVYADDVTAFEGQETVVIDAVGHTIGTGINAAQSQRILVADTVVELELGVSSQTFFLNRLTAGFDGQLEHRGSVVNDDDGTLSTFFEVTGDPAPIREAASGVPEVESITVVHEDDEGGLLEIRLGEESLLTILAELGARIQSMTASHGNAQVTIELTEEIDPRMVTDRITSEYEDVEVRAVREGQRRPTTKREFVNDIEETLTERQHTAMKRAFVSGYYDSTRTTTGEELAKSMGVSRATFHQHLRAAERKLIAEFLNR